MIPETILEKEFRRILHTLIEEVKEHGYSKRYYLWKAKMEAFFRNNQRQDQ